MIESRKTRSSVYVARMGKRSGAHKMLVEKHEGNSHLQLLGVYGKIILK
jgi:hypothetical protein